MGLGALEGDCMEYKEYKRKKEQMCKEVRSDDDFCYDCPLVKACGYNGCDLYIRDPQKAIEIVSEWYKAKKENKPVKIVIPFTLPGLNDYVNAERANRQKGAAFKKKWQNDVALVVKRQVRGKLKEPVVMHYTWYERDKRRDKDNVSAFGRKVIQDALVQIRALQNDGWSNIALFTDDFQVDKQRPRVEIEIEEAKK